MQQIMRFEQPLIHRMQWRSSRGEVNVSQMQKDCILSPSSFIFTVKTRESACRFFFSLNIQIKMFGISAVMMQEQLKLTLSV